VGGLEVFESTIQRSSTSLMRVPVHFVLFAALAASLVVQGQDPQASQALVNPIPINRQILASQNPRDLPPFSTDRDGARLLSLTFGFKGAAGVRLHFDTFHLPAGASVLLRNSDGSETVGPFTQAGPTGLGEFQSPPLTGDTVYLDFRVPADVPAILPFHVGRVTAVTPDELARFAVPPPPPAGGDSEDGTSLYRGLALRHQVKGGLALYDGDIILGNAKDLPPASSFAVQGRMQRDSFGIPNFPSSLWPGGVVPYAIDSSIVSTDTVVAAVGMWNSTTTPVISVVPRTTQSNYINFIRWSNSGLCSSWEGMIGGAQAIYVGDSCGAGDLAHEIGHAVGLLHEHDRVDRDTYVTINWENIISTYTTYFQIPSYGTDLGSYDYNSIMGYPTWAFSSNGQPSITTIPPGIPIGQRSGLSAGDIAGALQIYGGSSPPANVTVTLATNPPNLSVIVGGVSYASPKTITAPAGTVYSVSTSTPQGSASTQFVFANWSNGSPQSFTLTMPTSTSTLTANFSTQYLVTGSAGTGGSVSLSGGNSGGFYPANSSVTLTATPATGYCFSSWTGLNAGTPASATVTVSGPISATANFIPCGGGNCANLTPGGIYAGAAGISVPAAVSAAAGCAWTATSTASWISFPNGPSGTGPGTVTISVAPNLTGSFRLGFVFLGTDFLIVLQSN
jgi:hypothetical protein